MKYRHICSIAFSLVSDDENGRDLTPEMYRIAVKKHVDEFDEHDTWNLAIKLLETYPIKEDES